MSDHRPSVPTPLPCPFCGASRLEGSYLFHEVCANVPYPDPDEIDPWEPTLSICTRNGHYYVSCTGPKGVASCCEGPSVRGPMYTTRDLDKVALAAVRAVEAWNRRADGQMRMEV